MKNQKLFSILCDISLLSFGFMYLAMGNPQNTSDITIANIEALSQTESLSNPWHKAGRIYIITLPIHCLSRTEKEREITYSRSLSRASNSRITVLDIC